MHTQAQGIGEGISGQRLVVAYQRVIQVDVITADVSTSGGHSPVQGVTGIHPLAIFREHKQRCIRCHSIRKDELDAVEIVTSSARRGRIAGIGVAAVTTVIDAGTGSAAKSSPVHNTITGCGLVNRNKQIVGIVVSKFSSQRDFHPVVGCRQHTRHIAAEDLHEAVCGHPVCIVVKSRFLSMSQVDSPIFVVGDRPRHIVEADLADCAGAANLCLRIDLLSITIAVIAVYGEQTGCPGSFAHLHGERQIGADQA